MTTARRPVVPAVAAVPFLVAAGLAVAGWSPQEGWRHRYDLAIYLAAGEAVHHGESPYAYATDRGLGFTYPPVAVLPLTLLARLPLGLVHVLWCLAVAAVGWWLLRTVAAATSQSRGHNPPSQSRGHNPPSQSKGHNPPHALSPSPAISQSKGHNPPRAVAPARRVVTFRLVGAGVLAAATEPVLDSMVLGQLSPFVAAAGIAALLGTARAGVCAGVGGALKLTPLGVLVGALPLADRARRIAWGVGGFVVLTALGWLALPTASVDYFGHRVWETGRVGTVRSTSNTSLAGLLAHWGVAGGAAVRVAVVVAALLAAWWVWAAARRRASRLDLAIGAGCLVLLGVPVSWSHHALVVTAAVVALALHRSARARWLAVGLAALWAVPVFEWARDLGGLGGELLGSLRPLSLLALLVATARRGLTS